MKRQLKVLESLETLCTEKLNINMLEQHKPLGFTAEEVALECGCSRSNASSDLNALHREGLLVKLSSRSTYYLTVKWVETIFPALQGNVPKVVKHHREFLELAAAKATENKETSLAVSMADQPAISIKTDDSFKNLIGADGSLSMAVEQAKAAVLYPPKGLDTLLVGPTGVGKTLFAEHMYKFAQVQGKIDQSKMFVIFNCADYANNPQLLMSQLFGHARGAFTGADKEKPGLVERADGGMLFLDEVHRLPAEGQEMLFYLLDRGEFRRLGETDQIRRATVRIVAATTENPDSSLLKTFLRRIPLVIQLPELSARPLQERFLLIKFLLAREAVHLNSSLVISQDTLWSLLLYRCIGNIGQLRNDLQLVCAKAFLYQSDKNRPVKITHEMLPPKIRHSIVYDPQDRLVASRILCSVGSELLIQPNGVAISSEHDGKLPHDLYYLDEKQEIDEGRVGVIVIAHGNSTASSMAEFANQLFGVKHAKAIDMPLAANADWALEQAVKLADEIDEGKGIILLVDMGSLVSVGKELAKRTGKVVKSVEMVSTLMVMHALHKAILPQNDINVVYKAAWDARSLVQTTMWHAEPMMNDKEKAIITTCFTGQGAAAKVKVMLEKMLKQWQLPNIRVIALEAGSEEGLNNRLAALAQSHDIVASVGSIKPESLDKPHITLEGLMQGTAGSQLKSILADGLDAQDVAERYTDRGMDWEVMRGMVAGMLDEFLTFVNPSKVLDALMICTKYLEEKLEFEFSSSGLVRMLVHSACMVERLLTNAGINYPYVEKIINEHPIEYKVLKKAVGSIEGQFLVNVNDEELGHLIEIINLELQKYRME